MSDDGFRRVLERNATAQLRLWIMSIFRATALAIFDRINNDEFLFDSQTSQLRASIGIGVFEDGVLVNWITNPNIITSPKNMTYNKEHIDIDGRALLDSALKEMSLSMDNKWVMVLVGAVPYALAVDKGSGDSPIGGGEKQGKGWWSSDVVPFIEEEFKRNAKLLLR